MTKLLKKNKKVKKCQFGDIITKKQAITGPIQYGGAGIIPEYSADQLSPYLRAVNGQNAGTYYYTVNPDGKRIAYDVVNGKLAKYNLDFKNNIHQGEWVDGAPVLEEVVVTAPLNRDSKKVELASKNLARDQYNYYKQFGKFDTPFGWRNFYDNPDFDPTNKQYTAFREANDALGKAILDTYLTVGTLGSGIGAKAAWEGGKRFLLPKALNFGKTFLKNTLNPTNLTMAGLLAASDTHAQSNAQAVPSEDNGNEFLKTLVTYGLMRGIGGGAEKLFGKVPMKRYLMRGLVNARNLYRNIRNADYSKLGKFAKKAGLRLGKEGLYGTGAYYLQDWMFSDSDTPAEPILLNEQSNIYFPNNNSTFNNTDINQDNSEQVNSGLNANL